MLYISYFRLNVRVFLPCYYKSRLSVNFKITKLLNVNVYCVYWNSEKCVRVNEMTILYVNTVQGTILSRVLFY